MNPALAQKLMQEIGQLVYLGHSLQIELDQAHARIKELEEVNRLLLIQPEPS